MKSQTVYIADDNSQWTTVDEARKRDKLIEELKPIAARLPSPPNHDERIKLDPTMLAEVKEAIVAICRREFPGEKVFQYPSSEIHPMSYAGRFLSEVGGPINSIWWVLSCIHDGWLYQQPYYAINPEQWKGVDL